jgi:hypothetical protein
MATGKKILAWVCAGIAATGSVCAGSNTVAGPLYSKFSLTLDSGVRTEAAGPLFYSQQIGSDRQWGVPPFFALTQNKDLELLELDMAYPLVSYRSYGGEYRFQSCQLLSWTGGKSQADDTTRRFTIFPFYFQQRDSNNPSKNYTALVPFHGTLKNRLSRDSIRFELFPLYSETRKRDVLTTNILYPIYHERSGNKLIGRQVWPVWGHEIKGVTYRTNQMDEVEIIGGHDHFFAGFPFYMRYWDNLGTTNAQDLLSCIPFYVRTFSTTRDSTSYGWPFGYTVTEDREKGYWERDFLWPLYVVARGEGKHVTRIFPIYSRARSASTESDWYLWPLYKENYLHAPPLERKRSRVLFFLYSDTVECNTNSAESLRRIDLWPLYSSRREMNGNRQEQALSLLEPFFPNNEHFPREYAPVYTLWRREENAKAQTSSQSLLWNLYRKECSPETNRTSFLFGLFQRAQEGEKTSWRLFYLPTRKTGAESGPQAGH